LNGFDKIMPKLGIINDGCEGCDSRAKTEHKKSCGPALSRPHNENYETAERL
jgi:hypothetical protein